MIQTENLHTLVLPPRLHLEPLPVVRAVVPLSVSVLLTGRAKFCTGSFSLSLPLRLQCVQYFAQQLFRCLSRSVYNACNILHERLFRCPLLPFTGRAIFCTGSFSLSLPLRSQGVQYFTRAVISLSLPLRLQGVQYFARQLFRCLSRSAHRACNILHERFSVVLFPLCS